MFQRLGVGEVVVLLLLVLVWFGAKRIPDLARSLGRSLSEFKKGQAEGGKSEPDKEEKSESETEQKS